MNKSPKLLDQVRECIRVKHYSLCTENAYVDWIKRFILFHNKRHPKEMDSSEVEAFLKYLAVERHVSASTQGQAKAAILFLYKAVLNMDLPWLKEVVEAKADKRLPVVLTPREVAALLAELNGTMWLIVSLLYRTGMRLLEGLHLRVKDIEFERREIIIREGKGNKDRVTMLPENLMLHLQDQLVKVKQLHDKDLSEGFGAVYLPNALERKYPHVDKSWGWQYVFPSPVHSIDPRSGVTHRHHIYEQSVQKSVRIAAHVHKSTNRSHRMYCAILLQRIYCKVVMVSAQYKSYSVIMTFRPR